jgi:hypothetical protein
MLDALVAVAAGPPARPVRLGERAEEDLGGELLEALHEGPSGADSSRNRLHRLRVWRRPGSAVNENPRVRPVFSKLHPLEMGLNAFTFAPESS